MSQIYKNIKNSASKDFKSFSTQNDLPLTNVIEGTIAYVESVKTLYIYDSGAWYGIRLNNDPPVILDVPPERVLLTEGNTYTYELLAEDPDGLPLLWSFEIIEGDASGNPITLLGNQFSLTANNVGKAFVIKFSVNDGSLTTSSTTRFVLDVHEGLQGTGQLRRGLQLNLTSNDGNAIEKRNWLQIDPVGPNVLRLDVTRHKLRSGSSFPAFNDSSATTASFNGSNLVLLNNRVFAPASNEFREQSITNIFSYIGAAYTNTSLPGVDFDSFGYHAIDRSNNIIYGICYNAGQDTSIDVYSLLVGTSGPLTELAVRNFDPILTESIRPQLIALSGDRLVIFYNYNTGYGFHVCDKDSLETIGTYEVSGITFDPSCYAICQNFLFLLDATPYSRPKMFDLTDLNNITEVSNWYPQGIDANTLVKSIDLASERIIIGTQTTFNLYDFDSNNGTFGPIIDQPYTKDLGSTFRLDNTEIYGNRLHVKVENSGSFAQIYDLVASFENPPTADNINSQEELILGDTLDFTINGIPFSGRTITYSYITNDRQIGNEEVTIDSSTGQVTMSPVSVGDYALSVQYTLEDNRGEASRYNQGIVVHSRDGAGPSISNYLSTESALIPGSNNVQLLGDKALYLRNGYAIQRLGNQTLIININLPPSPIWQSPADVFQQSVYWHSPSEIYAINDSGVAKYTSVSNLENNQGSVTSWLSSNHPLGHGLGTGARWYEFNKEPNTLIWINNSMQATKFDISDPNNWVYIWGVNNYGGTTPTINSGWTSANDEWVCLHIAREASGNTRPILGFVRKDNGATTDWTVPSFSSSSAYFALSRDYIFISGNSGTLTENGDPSIGWIFVYRMSDDKETFTEVYRLRLPQTGGTSTITDIKFVQGVLYVMVYDTQPKTYIRTYNWDYFNETLNVATAERRCETYGDGAMYVDTNGVWTSNDRGNGDVYLTKFRGA